MEGKKASEVPETSTTLLRDVADSQHARWAVFHSRYEPMMQAFMRERFPSLDADDIIQETFVALANAVAPGDAARDLAACWGFFTHLTGTAKPGRGLLLLVR